jgi:hypothetical protein
LATIWIFGLLSPCRHYHCAKATIGDIFEIVAIGGEEMLVAQAFLDTGDIGDNWRQLATFLFLSPAATGDNSKQQPFLGLL